MSLVFNIWDPSQKKKNGAIYKDKFALSIRFIEEVPKVQLWGPQDHEPCFTDVGLSLSRRSAPVLVLNIEMTLTLLLVLRLPSSSTRSLIVAHFQALMMTYPMMYTMMTNWMSRLKMPIFLDWMRMTCGVEYSKKLWLMARKQAIVLLLFVSHLQESLWTFHFWKVWKLVQEDSSSLPVARNWWFYGWIQDMCWWLDDEVNVQEVQPTSCKKPTTSVGNHFCSEEPPKWTSGKWWRSVCRLELNCDWKMPEI